FERCSNASGTGSMTGFYTVLVEGDNLDEPVADETKSLLDGHIVLSSKILYLPRVDLLASESRVRHNLHIEAAPRAAAETVLAFLKQYRKDELNLDLGLFEGGDKARIRKRKEEKEAVDVFMTQRFGAPRQSPRQTFSELCALADKLPGPSGRPS